jgi:hypothetical protein
MALLLVGECAFSPENRDALFFPDYANRGARAATLCPPKKEARPKGTGQTLLIAAQYSQESLKNNVFFAVWLAEFGARQPLTRRLTSENWLKAPQPRKPV